MKELLTEDSFNAEMENLRCWCLFSQSKFDAIAERYQSELIREREYQDSARKKGLNYTTDSYLRHMAEETYESSLRYVDLLVRMTETFPIRHRENLKTAFENNHPQWRGKFDAILKTMGNGSIFILAGPRGTGKTQIATAISRYLAEAKNQQSCYTVLGDLFTRIKGTFKSESSESEDGIITQLSSTPLLVLDECHEITGTEWQCRILTLLIDSRYRAKRDTILITNQSQAGFIASVGESISDRIAECGFFIECDWQSFRRARL